MSLILDALKKSEQERRRDQAPDLQTIHQPLLARAPRRSYGALWGVLLVAANAAVVFYWWQQRAIPSAGNAQTTAAPVATAATPVGAAAVPAAVPPPIPTPAPAAQPVQATPEYTSITPAGAAPANAPNSADMRVEEVDELPEDIRNNLPAMTFSFHVYSSNPQQRTIIINNRRMREGDEISTGLQLQEITEDGVILWFSSHRIHVGVLSGW